jgi:hypothetical protein
VDFSLIDHFLPAIPGTRFHIKNKWFEAWPRWNHWLALAEPYILPIGQSSKTCFYNMLGKEDQLRNRGSGLAGNC